MKRKLMSFVVALMFAAIGNLIAPATAVAQDTEITESGLDLRGYTYAEAFGNANPENVKKLVFKRFYITGSITDNEYYYASWKYDVRVPEKAPRYVNADREIQYMDFVLLYKSNGRYYFMLATGRSLDELLLIADQIGYPEYPDKD